MTVKDELLAALMGHAAASGGAALADQAALSWTRIERKFAPLIGAASVALIVARSIERNLGAFGWLPVVAVPPESATTIDQLRTTMATQAPEAILAAHRAILSTFIDQMTTLIGARLTVQFLRAAIPADATGSNTEENA